MPNLAVEFAGMTFPNPIFASSGPITDSPENVAKCIAGGAGGIIGKTVTVVGELRRYTRPYGFALDKLGLRHHRLGCGALFADESPEEWVKTKLPGILRVCEEARVPFIQSIMGWGSDPDSWSGLARLMVDHGVEALELNFSCPHSPAVVEKSGSNLGMDPVAASTIVKAVKASVSVPVFVKLTSRGEASDEMAAGIEAAGADAISVFNVLNGIMVDVENMRPFGQPASMMGYPGAYMLPIALLKTAQINRRVKIPVYGGAGIWDAKGALSFIMLGNQAVQLQLAVMYRGYKLFGHIVQGIEKFMEDKGIRDLSEIRGCVLRQLVPNVELPVVARGEIVACVYEERCTGCGDCEACMYGAIVVTDGLARVEKEKCEGCGWCVGLCRRDAIYMERDGVAVWQY